MAHARISPEIRVLLIDDEPSLQRATKLFLERASDIRVDTATSGPEALRVLESEAYDAIVSDYQMPRMNGIEVLKALNAAGNETPFIIFTGKGREEIVIEALNHGAAFYVQKGGDQAAQYAELSHKIRQAVAQVRMHRKIEEERERIETVTRNIGAMLLIISRDYGVVWANEVTRNLYGDVTGKICYEEFHQSDHICPDCGVQQVFEGADKAVFQRETRDRHANPVWSEIISTPLRDRQGNTIAALEVAVPITHQKEVEEALRTAEQEKAIILNSVSETLILQDPDRRVLWANRAAAELSGMKSNELIGRHCFETWASRQAPCEHCPVSEALHTGQMRSAEITTPDGRKWRVRGDPVTDEEGRVIGAVETTREITEKKHAQEMIDKATAYNRAIIEASPDPFAIFDTDGIFTDVNRAAEQITGYPRAELIGSHYSRIFKNPERTRGVFKRVFDTGELRGHIAEIKHRDGHFTTVHCNATLFRNESGDIIGIFATARDISDLQKVQEQLRDIGGRFQRLTENINEFVFRYEYSPSPGFTYISPGVFAVTGRSPGDFLAEPALWVEGIHPDDRDQVDAIRRGEYDWNQIHIFRWRREDGSEVWVEEKLTPFFGEKGDLIALEGIVRDVTERERAREALQKSEERFRALAESTQDIILIIEKEGEVSYINPHGASYFSRSQGTLSDERYLRKFFTEDFILQQRVLVEEVFRTGKAAQNVLFDPLSGQWFEIQFIPSHIQEGTVQSVYCIARDITDHKNLENSLTRVNRKLTLLSSITRHDILNQITGMKGLAQLFGGEITDEGQLQKYISLIQASTEKIQRQIEFTRDYEQMGVTQPQWFNLAEVINRAAEAVTLAGIELSTEVGDARVYADPMLEKVFHNLIENALRHGIQLTRIRIALTEVDKGAIIVIEDDGVGVPAEMKAAIFEHGVGEDTGFGLFLSKEILEITGIDIRETGEEGKGARFEIRIPAVSYRRNNP